MKKAWNIDLAKNKYNYNSSLYESVLTIICQNEIKN